LAVRSNAIALWPLNAEDSKFSTPDVDKKQRGNVATREVEDWWEDLAEKEREKFQSLAVRSHAIALCPLGDQKQRRRQRFDRGRTSRQRGHFCLFLAISCCCEVYRDLNYSAPPCVGSTTNVDERHFSTLNADGGPGPCQEGGGKQTAYGIFARACWAQYDDEAGMEEFHIQCSDGWKDLAEKEREKFSSDWWEDLAEKE
jgi:hypothetical protein